MGSEAASQVSDNLLSSKYDRLGKTEAKLIHDIDKTLFAFVIRSAASGKQGRMATGSCKMVTWELESGSWWNLESGCITCFECSEA